MPPSQPTPQPANYDFIMNPQKPRRMAFNLPGGTSAIMRALYVAAGLLVLLIIFMVIKSLLFGGSDLSAFTPVAQDQEEMIHLVSNASQQQNITQADMNFAATAQLSLYSSRANLLQYLSVNGQKISTKVINLKVSTTIDGQLTNAASAGTYDQTFQQIMQSQLATYSNDLKQAYRQTSGLHGHALLSDDYNQAQLLLKQLGSASSQPQ